MEGCVFWHCDVELIVGKTVLFLYWCGGEGMGKEGAFVMGKLDHETLLG